MGDIDNKMDKKYHWDLEQIINYGSIDIFAENFKTRCKNFYNNRRKKYTNSQIIDLCIMFNEIFIMYGKIACYRYLQEINYTDKKMVEHYNSLLNDCFLSFETNTEFFKEYVLGLDQKTTDELLKNKHFYSTYTVLKMNNTAKYGYIFIN